MGWLEDGLNVLASVASAVGDGVEAVVTTVTEGADEVADSLADAATTAVETVTFGISQTAGSGAGAVANFFGGVVLGFVEGGRDMVHAGADAARGIGRVVSSLFRLDLPGVLQGFIDFYTGLLGIALAFGRLATGGYIVGAIVRLFERDELHRFIEEEILQRAFAGDVDLHSSARMRLRMDQADFGLRVGLAFRTTFFDSDTSDLATLHSCGHINLYALAGLDPFAFGTRFLRSPTVVTSVNAQGNDSWMPINRFTLHRHIESGGTANRLRVYALARPTANDRVRTAVRKFRKMRIHIEDPGVGWGWPYSDYPKQESIAKVVRNADGGSTCTIVNNEPRSWFTEELKIRRERQVLAEGSTRQLTGEHYLRDEGGRTGVIEEDCMPLALSVVGFTLDTEGKENWGITHGVDIRVEPEASPPEGSFQADRDDGAHVVINRVDRVDENDPTDDEPLGTGVVFRDSWPNFIFRWILAHELGHYFGLAHPGHSFKEIMFTIAKSQGLRLLDPQIAGFYLESEPEFTLKDAKNCWRFVADEMLHCIARPNAVGGTGRIRSADARSREPQRQFGIARPNSGWRH